ncbi:MAG: hypothetical protein WCO84_08465 [bacterium]
MDTTALTTGAAIGPTTYTPPTVGIGLVNGATMILAFNPACTRIDPMSNSADTTSCISMLYDMNGYGKPNKIGKDIAVLNSGIDCFDLVGVCVAASDTTYTSIDTSPSGSAEDKAFDPVCNTNVLYCTTNYWAGAKKACVAQGMKLPDQTQLNTMYLAKVAGTMSSVTDTI